MARSEGFGEVLRAFQNRNFRIFQIGRFFAHVTTWIYRTAIGWLVWDMTHSATWLGIIGFVDHVPAMVVAPLAGAWADRTDRLRVLQITQIHQVIQAAILSVLILMDLHTLGLLVLLAFYHGIIQGGQSPAMHSVVPNLVERDLLTVAYGVNSISFNVSRFIGPAIAGILISFGGSGAAILCHAVGAGVFALSLSMITLTINEPRRLRDDRNVLRDIGESVRYAARHEGIGPMMVIMVMIGLLTFSLVDLLPGFADGVFEGGANGYAWMIAAMGVGAIIQGALLTRRGPITGLTRYFNIHIAIVSVAILALTATDVYWVGLASVLLIGYAQSGTRVAPMTLLQNAVEGEMRGRISSFWTVIYQSSPAIGALVIGMLADYFGIRETFSVIAVLNLGVGAWVWHRQKTIAEALEYGPPSTRTDKPSP